MKTAEQIPLVALLALCAGMLASPASAVGTASGSTISNVASLRYTQTGNNLTIQSNTANLRVDEVLNVVVQSNDASNVVVATPDTHRVLVFTITNTGNTSLATTSDDVSFSNVDCLVFNYTPTPDGAGFDSAVKCIRVNPKGTFANSVATPPAFQLQFRVRIN